jgi:hypothetical protein
MERGRLTYLIPESSRKTPSRDRRLLATG